MHFSSTFSAFSPTPQFSNFLHYVGSFCRLCVFFRAFKYKYTNCLNICVYVRRSVGWGTTFADEIKPHSARFKLGKDQFANFVNNPNLLMLVVNQHHNVRVFLFVSNIWGCCVLSLCLRVCLWLHGCRWMSVLYPR